MKKATLFLFLLAAACGVRAQKISNDKVPVVVKESFQKEYPGITANWEKEAGKYEAGFKKNNNPMSVLIDASGNITETETTIPQTGLSATILTYIKENYKGQHIKEAASIVKADGTVTYEAEVAGKDLLFDANGKFIRRSKD